MSKTWTKRLWGFDLNYDQDADDALVAAVTRYLFRENLNHADLKETPGDY